MAGEKGFGLIEIVVTAAVVITALFAFSQAGILAVRLLRAEKENLEVILLAQEAVEAVRMIRDESWTQNIAPLTNGTLYYPIVENGKWKLAATSPGVLNGKYTRFVLFEEVFRDAQDRIAVSGTSDSNTKKLTARVNWSSGKQTELVTYLTNFPASLSWEQESKVISFEDAATAADLANFPSNNSGDGDPVQSFTTVGAIQATKAELFLKRITVSPSNIYVELRTSPTGNILGTSNTVSASTIASSSLAWVEFRFPDKVSLSGATVYHIRLRSIPSSTDSGSGSTGTVYWGYKQTASSPYSGGEARRYVGRLSNPSDSGQLLDQYDFGFRIYAFQ